MIVNFYKYQGTGNDFVLIDNRDLAINRLDFKKHVARLCDRRFGVGGDGLILLQNKSGYDFEMVYFNADGGEVSMCGNGGRCIVQFARNLGIVKDKTKFYALDGDHDAILEDELISIKMKDVTEVKEEPDCFFLNTGVPHYVTFVDNVENFGVFEEGKKIRYNTSRFGSEGTNANFVETQPNQLFVRTYERGVEDETFSCGTGVTACALVASLKGITSGDHCDIKTLGGNLKVKYTKHSDGTFTDIWLQGPAHFVFKGEITV